MDFLSHVLFQYKTVRIYLVRVDGVVLEKYCPILRHLALTHAQR